MRGLLAVVTSLVEHELQATRAQQLRVLGSAAAGSGLQHTRSIVVAHGLRCSVACESLPDQGSNPCLLSSGRPRCSLGWLWGWSVVHCGGHRPLVHGWFPVNVC